MSEMPPLGHSSRGGATIKRVALGVLVAGLAAAAVLEFRRPAPPPLVQVAPPPVPVETPPPPKTRSPLERAGLHRANVIVAGPLETALVSRFGRPLGQALTQVSVRELVWWLEIPSDFRKGDVLDVLFEERAGEEPLVHAVRFKSQKLGQTFRAFRFKSSGSAWARFYQPGGQELELRLENSPLDDYEQITSLLRDGRGHKGVDFKTPTGTPVKAPFDGVVSRKNWNPRMNGNSLEIKESGGDRIAIFLHLSELPKETRLGDHVARGEVVAKSGNTGHSYAPHLHYQLMTASHPVVDPFGNAHVVRLRVPDADKAAFDAEAQRLEALFDAPIAGS